MYRDLRKLCWWPGLKREITDFVGKCLTCQQVKAEHQLPSGWLQPVKISLWKWERKLAKLYVSKIVRLHGVPVSIISYRNPHFNSRFWKNLHEDLGTRLDFSTTFYPQKDAISLAFRWHPTRHYMVIGVAHLHVGLSWAEVVYRPKASEIEYSVGDFIFLKVSPWKKVLRFGRKGKLSPRFIGPYHILKRVRPVTYQLELPPKLDRTHDVFHVSILRRYRSDPMHIVLIEEIEVKPDLTIEEESVQILERDVKVLKRKSIPLVKVLWCNHSSEEATWEPEDAMRQQGRLWSSKFVLGLRSGYKGPMSAGFDALGSAYTSKVIQVCKHNIGSRNLRKTEKK
ncbi:uncharacterized protein LOC128036205 [Gossypium raimondii]|uniref:uncharacterized protein LOC128036205 n=1 Tax=Gossypium raimondii TaxID=29730 RepID=UPI00227C5709|nr:uncharacterized protein LOC128036205 [Gossypium raimondii]